MSNSVYKQIRSNPKYVEMVARRRRLSWSLAGIVLGIFFAFVLVIAFNPKVLATPVAEGAVTTIAVPLGVA
ncbi:MAG: DUF485 domain-containing protein, partial [Burkholderiales bacterium]